MAQRINVHAVYGLYKKRQSQESRALFCIREGLMYIKATNIEIFGHLLERA